MEITSLILQLMVSYYACDHVATQRMMSHSETVTCMQMYDELKKEVTGIDPLSSPENNIAAYKAWKMWEKENTDLVLDLKYQGKQYAIDNNML